MNCPKCKGRTEVTKLKSTRLVIGAYVETIFECECKDCGLVYDRKYLTRIDIENGKDIVKEE